MKGQQNPIVQIVVGVTIPVVSAFLIWKLGIEERRPSPPPEVRVIMPQQQDDRRENVYPSHRPKYIQATIVDKLGLDLNGLGQVVENVAIEIGGGLHSIELSAVDGKSRGKANIRLPQEGFYDFEVKATTVFNNHQMFGQLCTHNGYGSGKIYVEDGDVFELMMDLSTIHDPYYKAFLQKN
ncbi:MAG: hypothetical protein AAF135_04080 [Bacteroidota bacterium]